MTERTQQQRLEEDFDQAILQTTPKGGRNLTYIPIAEVVARLNSVLGAGGWDWKVTKIWRDQLNPEWMLAVGELTCTIDGNSSTRSGSGGVEVSVGGPTSKNPGKIVDLGDEAKGAESDALKKAAQRFGVGLSLGRTPAAIQYEMKQLEEEQRRDPIKEGWESAERATQIVADLVTRIKNSDDEVRTQMQQWRESGGVVAWPPTKVEYTRMEARFQSLVDAYLHSADQNAYEANPYELPGPVGTYVPPESQESPLNHASEPHGISAVQPPPEMSKTATEAVTEAFPGAEDVTPAESSYVTAVLDHVARFKAQEDVGASRAFNKYAKEKGISKDPKEWTQPQVELLLDFIDEL